MALRARLTTTILAALLLGGAAASVGCAPRSPYDRARLSSDIDRRTGHGLRPLAASQAERASPRIPPGVALGDGLSEDEAVAVGLWNNPGFQADLASLGLARADLVEAGMIRNPLLTLLLPLGPKQLELTASLPLESLWQRPRRVAAARADVERAASSLVQSALDLVRDVKVAYADTQLARARDRLAHESLELRRRIARITDGRLAAGDISRAQATMVQIDADTAELDLGRAGLERAVAEERLRALLGLEAPALPSLSDAPPEPRALGDADEGVRAALALRPDLRAAELAIEAAAARVGWERARAVNQVAAIADANGAGKEGFELGPGLALELPLFNQNRGGMARAAAEVERAAWQYLVVRHRIGLEVRSAHHQYQVASQTLEALRRRVLPAVAQTVGQAEKAYTEGDASHLFVLEAARQQLDARAREAELVAGLRRAGAELDRSVGRKRVEGDGKK